ncbi:MAG: glycosyltransferase family 9 protein [Culturomica sp.]|jgi:ADP-heptose:LPS heptosyltransferase|nr:glycosyltransferase family 9 protein [Culturomica sp.]
MKHILVIRLSAFGDVVMTVPVITSFAKTYPDVCITVLSRKGFQDLFTYMPANVRFFGANLNGEHKGFIGLIKLFRQLNKLGIDAVADCHDVLRTKILRLLFLLGGKKVRHINKGRREKRRATCQHCKKQLHQLPTSFERYRTVFRKLGFDFQWQFRSIFDDTPAPQSEFQRAENETWIGVAPFSKQRAKIYPSDSMEKIVNTLADIPAKVFLFGGKGAESLMLNEWAEKYPNIVSVAGKMTIIEELALMNRLDVMLSMDSANMHLASIAGVPVVSVWGSTHPFLGFMGWGQNPDNAVQTDEYLVCRPCSVFGNKPCFRKDYECLLSITTEQIVEKVMQQLK